MFMASRYGAYRAMTISRAHNLQDRKPLHIFRLMPISAAVRTLLCPICTQGLAAKWAWSGRGRGFGPFLHLRVVLLQERALCIQLDGLKQKLFGRYALLEDFFGYCQRLGFDRMFCLSRFL